MDSLNIAALRAKAKGLREQADQIDMHVDALLRLIGASGDVSAPARRAVVRERSGDRKSGKQPGAISMRWRDNFTTIHMMDGATFTIGRAIEVVRNNEARDLRPSEARRLFKTNVGHGHLIQVDEDTFTMTPQLLRMIGVDQKHEGPSVTTEGPNVGGVAERLNAPDYESGGGVGASARNSAFQTPVGSNPTASAPSSADIFAGISLAPFNPPTR